MRGWVRRETIPYADPLRAGRHPFQTYMLVLCVISGLPLLLGHVTAGSISASLPGWLATTWGAFLLVGSTTALAGSYWRGDYATALTIERIGLIIAGAAGLAYAAVVFLNASNLPFIDRLTGGAIILGFGASCVRRARDIGNIFHRASEVSSTVVAREGESDGAAAFRDAEAD